VDQIDQDGFSQDREMQEEEPTQLDLKQLDGCVGFSLSFNKPNGAGASTQNSSCSHLSTGKTKESPFVLPRELEGEAQTPKMET